jgi:hypothetical protein
MEQQRTKQQELQLMAMLAPDEVQGLKNQYNGGFALGGCSWACSEKGCGMLSSWDASW